MGNLRAFYARGVIGYVLGTVIRRRYLISGIQYSDEYQDYDERSTRQSAEGRVSDSYFHRSATRAGKDVCKGFENQRYLVWYDLP